MKKLSINDIVEFREKSDKGKRKFANDIKINVEKKDDEGGGNYWVCSLSAISSSYRANDLQIIKNKISELEEKLDNTEYKRTKIMYQRNIDILYHCEDFDFKKWRPSVKIEFLKKSKTNSVLTIKELKIQTSPHHVFAFEKNEIKEIGAIWFIAKLGGYRKDELGMFADLLYRYLNINYSNDYIINPKY